ncbi:MAG: CRISPR-associated helicase Cas3' [Anaerolineaceae bacterium]|nr:CRISPR-associated helicase Cas3' [Anaerolineaceae bacterium]
MSEKITPSDKLIACWGKIKTIDEINQEYHPAIYHLIDAGNVAKILLSEPRSKRWRNSIDNLLENNERRMDWVPFSVALHDLGKLSDSFQQQSNQKERLKQIGLHFSGIRIRHEIIGQYSIAYEQKWSEDENILKTIIRDVTASHHGVFYSTGRMIKTKAELSNENDEWKMIRKEAFGIIKSIFIDHPSQEIKLNVNNLSAAIMMISGFTTLCDWIASNKNHFPPNQTEINSYREISIELAERAVKEDGFGGNTFSITGSKFNQLFRNINKRPLQQAIDDIPQNILKTPFLSIIEAPTGEGKTEAALALAHRIAQYQNHDEIYYALPTMATSNQMYGRLITHLTDNLNLPHEIQLIHGQAYLIKDEIDSDFYKDIETETDKTEWFSSLKRAILAPFGVGTIDQAELGALKVKHNSLRLAGLAGKTLIIDEVHAYDVYMTTIIARLLEWLSALSTSVILLSATLPIRQRNELIKAYSGKAYENDNGNEYPRIWIASEGNDTYTDTPIAYQPGRNYQIKWINIENNDAYLVADWLIHEVEEGGCVCWISNTVKMAQEIYRELLRRKPSDIESTLLHGSFPLNQRESIEKEIKDKYGPNGIRPNKGIVIGTQVLEQSLDLDFDVMGTDLAPIDFILQRAGRLHRHERQRPERHTQAILTIRAETDTGKLNPGNSKYVYDEYLLRKTWEILSTKTAIKLPEEYRTLVEAIYQEQAENVDSQLKLLWGNLKDKETDARQKAQIQLMPRPKKDETFCQGMDITFEENENQAGWLIAKTRLTQESISVLIMETDGTHAWFQGEDKRYELNKPVQQKEALEIMRHNLKITHPTAIKAIKENPIYKQNALFEKSPLLINIYPIFINDNKTIISEANLVLELDPQLGLTIRKKG